MQCQATVTTAIQLHTTHTTHMKPHTVHMQCQVIATTAIQNQIIFMSHHTKHHITLTQYYIMTIQHLIVHIQKWNLHTKTIL